MDGNNPKKVRKRLKRSNTIEKNLKNLNVNKFELEFDVDPLFKKTSSQFDGAFGGNQFLATLEVMDESGELLLDSEVRIKFIFAEKNYLWGQEGTDWMFTNYDYITLFCVLMKWTFFIKGPQEKSDSK